MIRQTYDEQHQQKNFDSLFSIRKNYHYQNSVNKKSLKLTSSNKFIIEFFDTNTALGENYVESDQYYAESAFSYNGVLYVLSNEMGDRLKKKSFRTTMLISTSKKPN